MMTNKKAFEQLYANMLADYYGDNDYVPLLTENETKTIPTHVYDEFEEGLIQAISEVMEDVVIAA